MSNESEWNAAVAAAAPGDVIRITATIKSRLVYRGDNDGGSASGADGTAAAPIVITADPGAWIDPGNWNSGYGALDILYTDHVHAVGVNVRNAQFGIRCHVCRGSEGAPIRIASSTVSNIGHAGIHVSGHWQTHAPSQHVVVELNRISDTGKSASQFGEGVYVGYGGQEWIDQTSNVLVRGNDISRTGAEGVDIKPGTFNIHVEDNNIHDLSPVYGGAISAHYVSLSANPDPGQVDQVIIRRNRIWNQNLDGRRGSNDWAIWVGHGGVEITDNVIWGLRNSSGTRAVRIRGLKDFGPHPIVIENNVFWTTKGWVAEGQPSGAGNVQASGNQGPDQASNEVLIGADVFVGSVPKLGEGGTADAGRGPGSAFQLRSAVTTTTAPPPTTAPATTAPPTTAPATTAPATTAPASAPVPSVELEQLSDQELLRLIRSAADELDRRG